MDYSVWELLKQKVYRDQLTGNELKRKILEESWQEIGVDDVRKCISAWKKRLRSMCEQ